MALGGVDTGSMKPIDAPRHAPSAGGSGSTPAAFDTAIATGTTAVFAHRETAGTVANTGVQVELAVPLKSEGEVLGVLAVEDSAGNQFTDSELAFFEAVASQIALAWRNARLFEQIRKSKIYLELVLNAADDTSIMSIDREGRIITFNSGSETLLGLSAEEAVGRPIHEILVSNWQSVQYAERSAFRRELIGAPCVGHRALGDQRDDCVDFRVDTFDARQVSRHDLAGGHFSSTDPRHQLHRIDIAELLSSGG